MGRPSGGRDPRVALQWTRPRPNKRLKLAGGDRFKGKLSVVPWRARTARPLLLRRRASRPQLKRDPLGRDSRTYETPLNRFAPGATLNSGGSISARTRGF